MPACKALHIYNAMLNTSWTEIRDIYDDCLVLFLFSIWKFEFLLFLSNLLLPQKKSTLPQLRASLLTNATRRNSRRCHSGRTPRDTAPVWHILQVLRTYFNKVLQMGFYFCSQCLSFAAFSDVSLSDANSSFQIICYFL